MSRETKDIYGGKKGKGREGNGKLRAEDMLNKIYMPLRKFKKFLKYERSLGRQ